MQNEINPVRNQVDNDNTSSKVCDISNGIKIFCAKDWVNYEMLDTGDGEKLERFGKYTFVRPFEDAVWSKTLTKEVKEKWAKADGKFWSSKVGAKAGWKMNTVQSRTLHKWEMEYKGIKFFASPTPFRHMSFFPEQASHWDFIETRLRNAPARQGKIKFLNLFGYTGLASLFALRAGAEVTHVDASKLSVALAKENQKLNPELAKRPMRVIVDDVIKFLEREIKRGNKYDAIIMDPPKFGRGPKGEVWKLEENLGKLLELSRKVLSDKPLFVILNSYAVDSSSLPLGYALKDAMRDLQGEVTAGELCLFEKAKGRLIPLSNTAIWEKI